jgi:murein DD-endopeptidase MepM/ murein hydrolase activator NlpD
VLSAQSPARTVAIGDIHGDADAFVQILTAAQLVDPSQHWSGGTATFVQTGDYFDRGPGVRRVLDLLMAIEPEAKRAGGRAEILLGNHEVMNLLQEFRDVSPAAFASFADAKSEERRTRAFDEYAAIQKRAGTAPDDGVKTAWMNTHPPGFFEYVDAIGPKGKYGRWLRDRKVAVKIDGTIFMHAGIAPDTYSSVDDVNRAVERALEDWEKAKDMLVSAGVARPFFTFRETLNAAVAEYERISAALKAGQPPGDHVTREFGAALQTIADAGKSPLLAAEGPLWFRGLAQWSSPDDDAQVQALLSRLGAERFVVGHTPQLPGKITPKFGGRVYPIDTGMLSGYFKGGRASALEIQGDRLTAIYTTGREELTK